MGLKGWTYQRYEVTEVGLAGFVDGCGPEWRGLSLTMPLKSVALALGEVDPLAVLVGAANTVIFGVDGRQVFNTDVGGLVWALQQAGVDALSRVTVLGSGATARSALVSVAQLGASDVTVVARDLTKAERLRGLADTLQMRLAARAWDADLPVADLVISTVTAGAADARADELAVSAPMVFDAIYDPWPTVLAHAASRAGRTVLNGLDLLVGQALLQVELMTGQRVDPAVLMAAGRAALRGHTTEMED